MRVLLTGARGLLGAAIVREFHDADVQAFGHDELDVGDEAAVADAVERARPDILVNCAAYNDVDRAEHEAAAALRVNALGVLALARAARLAGAVLVHYSTDFVFDGETDRPYTEEDPPNPRSLYATSKLLGDWFARDATRAYVLRVDSLFGHPGPNGARRGSLATIVDRIRSGAEVPVFIDRTVSPSYTTDVARATRAVVSVEAAPGVYHCVNAGVASWAQIAEEAARLMGLTLHMKPLTLESAKLSAPRPRYCALSPAKLAAAGIVMPTWQDALRRYLSIPNPSSLIPHP
jgi:dTDP-4-dehydrorhamnose reductase